MRDKTATTVSPIATLAENTLSIWNVFFRQQTIKFPKRALMPRFRLYFVLSTIKTRWGCGHCRNSTTVSQEQSI